MSTKTHDRGACIFWIVVGIYTAVYGYRLGLGRLQHPGPGFIFFGSAVCLTILGIISLAGTFFGKAGKEKVGDRESMWQGVRWGKVLSVLAGVSICAYLFNIIGFLLSTVLLMVFLYKAVEPTKWWVAIVSSLITVFLSYILFVKWLEVPFPKGLIGF